MAKKKKFYNCRPVSKVGADYIIVHGERSNGKSFNVVDFCLENYAKHGRRFMLLRRYQDDYRDEWLTEYFKDKPISKHLGEEYDGAERYKGKIYTRRILSDDGEEFERAHHIGYARALTRTTATKSANFDDVDDIIFEEFITADGYLPRETIKLMNMVSTVARRRKIRVWLIGNSISRLCPYFTDWGLANINKQKPGTIDIYKHETQEVDDDGNAVVVTIAVERCEHIGGNGGMLFGRIGHSLAGGEWETNSYRPLPKDIRLYTVLHTIIFEHNQFTYRIRMITAGDGYYCLYVDPVKKVKDTDRIISKNVYPNMMYTQQFIPINQWEQPFFNLLKMNHVYYCNNLVGTEFNSCLKEYLK